ncbi:MAG TPA: hypothetical protein VIY53_20030 [Acidobacteriaceae bacterium]
MQESNEAGAMTRVGNWNRPAHHQCAHVHESGVRCNATTGTGRRLCHAHQRYNDSDPLYPIQVPLLEDTASIRFVISQTNRQLAMGAIPPANGRAMLYGCRMALDLLLYEQAREKRKFEQEKMEKKLAAAEAAAASVSELTSQQVSELANGDVASEIVVESRVCENRAGSAADLVEACAADPEPVIEPEAEPESEPLPFLRRREPRFADLRGQWDKAMGRLSREISANLTATEDEDGEAWRARMNGPLQAGHPQMRQAHPYLQNAIAAGRSADASAYGDRPVSELGPRDLPFNPAFPPQYRSGMMDEWREEHIAAWYRCLIPTAREKEVREYASSIYKGIQEEKAEAAAHDPVDGLRAVEADAKPEAMC